MRKPANLVYGVDEAPPHLVTLISAVQHVAVIAIFMIYPLIIGRAAGAPADVISAMLRMGMLALAVAVALQALPRGPVGSRFLAPSIFTGVYLAPSLLAAKTGGLPLVWGMTIFAGLVEIALAQVWTKLRTLIPSETAGLVVFLIGVIIGLAALRALLGEGTSGAISARDAIITGLALAVMIGLNIWNKGQLRLFCILIGMVVGYIASAATGLLTADDFRMIANQPLVAFPTIAHVSFAFDPELIIPFAVSGLAAAMGVTAVIATYQRTTDADWIRPEMNSIRGGIFADGIAASIAGLLGTYGLTVSTANVGLVAATGVASRRIAFVVAAILAVAALFPGLVAVFTIMPPPVMAAALLFTSVFIMIGGVQIISTRVLDSRRTLVIGMGMMAFFVVSVFPSTFAGLPHWVEPLVSSPLVLATLVALALNLLFRLGIRRKVTMSVDPAAADYQEVANFVERNAAIWGARRDVVTRVEFAVQQAAEAIVEYCRPTGPIAVEIGYDEFDIDVTLRYPGRPLELSGQLPTQDEILESEEGAQRLAAFLIMQRSDKVKAAAADGVATLALHFRH
ncbi:MAG TPA: solute carrier family 23 protein [Xanthobacteraceae bacterium]|nr:solute carrier family 23 protein [Xanthobacteraceae bacterium]